MDATRRQFLAAAAGTAAVGGFAVSDADAAAEIINRIGEGDGSVASIARNKTRNTLEVTIQLANEVADWFEMHAKQFNHFQVEIKDNPVTFTLQLSKKR